MSKRELEDLDLLSAIWILASNDENHLITFEGIRDRLGLSPKYDVHELIRRRRELFRPGAPPEELEQWKGQMRDGNRRPLWVRQMTTEDDRLRAIDRLSQNDVFRSQFRSSPGADVSPIAVVDWGLQHLDRLRKSRLAISEAAAKSWQMWLVFAVSLISVVVSIVLPLWLDARAARRGTAVGIEPTAASMSKTSAASAVVRDTTSVGLESRVNQQISVAQLFLVAISIFAVALAEARNEKLKTGLSLAGIVISVAWGLSVWCVCPNLARSMTENVLSVLPALASGGWLIAAVIHAGNWMKGEEEK